MPVCVLGQGVCSPLQRSAACDGCCPLSDIWGPWLLPSSTGGLCSPKQDSLMEDYPENSFLGLLDEHRNLLQLLPDLPVTAVQQLQLLSCSV